MLEPVKKDDPIIVRHQGGLTKTAFFVKFLDAERVVLRFELAGERIASLADGRFEIKRQKERAMCWWSVDLHDLERLRMARAQKK